MIPTSSTSRASARANTSRAPYRSVISGRFVPSSQPMSVSPATVRSLFESIEEEEDAKDVAKARLETGRITHEELLKELGL
ncbi:hypothetical protein [Boudabousia marimammalium]|uniref:hypothetical protein n=1 Tax=Boudabousia marimammalium TaxID=156892 RepID=UPI001177B8FE|nr:hypothetical protein [Boudabousia marimammalium]